jgi:curved DNA-binding protein CbpA
MSNPPPALTGTLASTPLVTLLVYALDHRLTGTLVLEQPSGHKHAVLLHDGAPAKARLAEGGIFLGEVLIALGKLTESDHQLTLQQATSEQRLHGAVLLDAGLVDEASLKEALREQLAQKLAYMAELEPESVWGYYDRTNYLERYGAPELLRGRALASIWRLVQAQSDSDRVDEIIARIGGGVLMLHQQAPISRFHFGRREQAVIDVLRAKPQPYDELLARDLVAPALLAKLVYMLAITRQLEVGSPDLLPLGSSEPPSSAKPLAPVAPAEQPPEIFRRPSPAPEPAPTPDSGALAPELHAFRLEIKEKLAQEENYYQLLSVSPQSEATEIHQSYLRLAKKWHPDRLGPEYADVREAVMRIFSRMTEAQQTLCDVVKRREYDQRDRRAAREAEEAEQVHRILRGATSFQRAEILLKRNNLPMAEEEARKAIADDPGQPEYRALLAWLEAQKAGADPNASIAALDKVISASPNDVRARWYRGQLYKRVGRDTRAVRDFRAIVEQDPRHVDAQREIRLFEMRHSGRPPSDRPSDSPAERSSKPPAEEKARPRESGSGLLSRIFKR